MKLLLVFIFLVLQQNFVYAQSDSIIVHQLAKDVTATQLNYLVVPQKVGFNFRA